MGAGELARADEEPPSSGADEDASPVRSDDDTRSGTPPKRSTPSPPRSPRYGDVIRLEATDDFPERLRAARPDIVFNIAEGLHGTESRSARPGDLRVLRHPVLRQRPVHARRSASHKARTKDILTRARHPERAVLR